MKFWIGVASKEHVQRGVAGGFCQLCHGNAQPLKRMSAGDWIIYYSSKQQFNAQTPCRQFTAIGSIVDDRVYEFAMSPDFTPFRRKVRFLKCESVDIAPLIEELTFIRNKARWGGAFRFGHLQIPNEDFKLIAAHMVGFDPTDLSRESQLVAA